MGNINDVTDATFDRVVIQAGQPVLVDFWAPRCKPCLLVAPLLEELIVDYGSRINFVKLDIDQNQETARKFKVMSIPNLIIFKAGKPVKNMVGFKPKAALRQELDAALA